VDKETTWFQSTIVFIFPLLIRSSFPLPESLFVTVLPLGIRYISKPPPPTSLPLHGVVSFRWAMFTNHWQRQVVFFPSSTLLVFSRLLTYLQSFTFLPQNQSTKGIRSLVAWWGNGWCAFTPFVYRDARTRTHIAYCRPLHVCVHPPALFFLKRPWNCCLGNILIVFQLSYSFSPTKGYTYEFLLVIYDILFFL